MSDRKEMLQEALMAQRQMLVDAIGKRAEDIPQAFTPVSYTHLACLCSASAIERIYCIDCH